MNKTGFEFLFYDIRICFGFPISEFEFILMFLSAEIKV